MNKKYIAIVAVILGISFFLFFMKKDQSLFGSAQIEVNGEKISVLTALTDKAQFQGLSGRDSLSPYGGMLFVFPSLGFHSMVMRDMKFPLDMIWLKNGEITDLAENLPPEPGRGESNLTVYTNTIPGNMVIEFPAGFITKKGLKKGDMLVIPNQNLSKRP